MVICPARYTFLHKICNVTISHIRKIKKLIWSNSTIFNGGWLVFSAVIISTNDKGLWTWLLLPSLSHHLLYPFPCRYLLHSYRLLWNRICIKQSIQDWYVQALLRHTDLNLSHSCCLLRFGSISFMHQPSMWFQAPPLTTSVPNGSKSRTNDTLLHKSLGDITTCFPLFLTEAATVCSTYHHKKKQEETLKGVLLVSTT